MAASTTPGFLFPTSAQATSIVPVRTARRRHIDPPAGHALEMLGHAIEYLTDELIHDGAGITANNERVQAVQLLMALNRQVYFECPFESTFGERCRSFLRTLLI
jgi:hypothetical protein